MLDPAPPSWAQRDSLGLTPEERRRFEMTKAVLQGLIARNTFYDAKNAARLSVEFADATLKELGLA